MFSSNGIIESGYQKTYKIVQNANILTTVTTMHTTIHFEHVLKQYFVQIARNVIIDFDEKFKEWAQHQSFYILWNNKFSVYSYKLRMFSCITYI